MTSTAVRLTRRTPALVLALLLALGGCVDEPTGESTSKVIGANGGTITHEGVTLVFPKGALLSDTPITITTMHDAAPAGFSAYSPIYRFEPDGSYFRKKVTATFAYEGAPAAVALIWSVPGGAGVVQPGRDVREQQGHGQAETLQLRLRGLRQLDLWHEDLRQRQVLDRRLRAQSLRPQRGQQLRHLAGQLPLGGQQLRDAGPRPQRHRGLRRRSQVLGQPG